ncbi:MAG: hypothetical protein JSU83_01345 [Deltaproteobacteria bacterium]|nr:MAG: hypothetical protein JSU83_01345 [Deltaproteobacteria bacterium]
MIKFYTNRELAQKLGINLAKWKRWSREFLPPDPLGGMQSGFARQYSIDDAFKVFLGGHLVSTIKFTIPEAKKILEDLRQWLKSMGIYQNSSAAPKLKDIPDVVVKRYVIFIYQQPSFSGQTIDFFYAVRGIISDIPVEHEASGVREQRYIELLIPTQKNIRAVSEAAEVKILNITAVLQQFIEALNISKTLYRIPGKAQKP